MPKMNLFRPCDPIETAECWELALSNEKAPSVLSLTRQNLPTLRKKHVPENLCALGAYEISPPSKIPEVILIATGSEVSIAMEAQERLESEGIATKVVSMPSWKHYEMQSDEYKEALIPSTGPLKVAVEAANRFGWDRYIGRTGVFIGIEDGTYGRSAPYQELYEHYGITADNIFKQVRKRFTGSE
jgi:transketolase